MRSGYMAIYDGYLWSAGVNGYYWSSTAATVASSISADAYRLGFLDSSVVPSYDPYVRWYGFPLRCQKRVCGADGCKLLYIGYVFGAFNVEWGASCKIGVRKS